MGQLGDGAAHYQTGAPWGIQNVLLPTGVKALSISAGTSHALAIGSDGNLYVTTYIPAALFKIAVKDGKAGAVTELKTSRAIDHADAMRAFGDSFLLIEGAGRLTKITVKGDEAQVDTIAEGLSEPVSVTQVGNTLWVAEGKLSYIIGDNKEKDPGPFTIKPVALK